MIKSLLLERDALKAWMATMLVPSMRKVVGLGVTTFVIGMGSARAGSAVPLYGTKPLVILKRPTSKPLIQAMNPSSQSALRVIDWTLEMLVITTNLRRKMQV